MGKMGLLQAVVGDQPLGNLYGVEGSALLDLVAYEPEGQTVLVGQILAYTAYIDVILTGQEQWHRINLVGRVVHQLYALALLDSHEERYGLTQRGRARRRAPTGPPSCPLEYACAVGHLAHSLSELSSTYSGYALYKGDPVPILRDNGVFDVPPVLLDGEMCGCTDPTDPFCLCSVRVTPDTGGLTGLDEQEAFGILCAMDGYASVVHHAVNVLLGVE